VRRGGAYSDQVNVTQRRWWFILSFNLTFSNWKNLTPYLVIAYEAWWMLSFYCMSASLFYRALLSLRSCAITVSMCVCGSVAEQTAVSLFTSPRVPICSRRRGVQDAPVHPVGNTRYSNTFRKVKISNIGLYNVWFVLSLKCVNCTFGGKKNNLRKRLLSLPRRGFSADFLMVIQFLE